MALQGWGCFDGDRRPVLITGAFTFRLALRQCSTTSMTQLYRACNPGTSICFIATAGCVTAGGVRQTKGSLMAIITHRTDCADYCPLSGAA